MQLSIIILNYNVRYFLEQCILSVQLAIQNLDAEIIVIDNNSADDSCEMVRKRFPNITFIENKENAGFPKGNNIGVAAAQGEYICILNPDTVVAEDTFEKVLAFAEKQNNLGIIGVKLVDGTGNFLPESKRGVPTPFVAFTKVTGLYKISKTFGKYYAQHLNENQTGKVEILVGAFMVMKRDLYLEVGGFDENCFMYSDDIDLSYMVLKKGKSNFYFHETTVIHYKGESTVRDKTYMKHFRQAMDFFYKKHFRSPFLFNGFMKVGAFFFALMKKKQAVVSKKHIAEYLWLSNGENQHSKVENLLGKKVAHVALQDKNDLNSLMSGRSQNTEIIFDNNSIDFKTIIAMLEKYKNSGLTFKILPKDSNFIIGSNSSNDRGEIIKLETGKL